MHSGGVNLLRRIMGSCPEVCSKNAWPWPLFDSRLIEQWMATTFDNRRFRGKAVFRTFLAVHKPTRFFDSIKFPPVRPVFNIILRSIQVCVHAKLFHPLKELQSLSQIPWSPIKTCKAINQLGLYEKWPCSLHVSFACVWENSSLTFHYSTEKGFVWGPSCLEWIIRIIIWVIGETRLLWYRGTHLWGLFFTATHWLYDSTCQHHLKYYTKK